MPSAGSASRPPPRRPFSWRRQLPTAWPLPVLSRGRGAPRGPPSRRSIISGITDISQCTFPEPDGGPLDACQYHRRHACGAPPPALVPHIHSLPLCSRILACPFFTSPCLAVLPCRLILFPALRAWCLSRCPSPFACSASGLMQSAWCALSIHTCKQRSTPGVPGQFGNNGWCERVISAFLPACCSLG